MNWPEDAKIDLAVWLQTGDFDPEATEVWFAGKVLQRGKLLRDHVGSNEKTKVIVKLQEQGDLRPSREPVSTCHLPIDRHLQSQGRSGSFISVFISAIRDLMRLVRRR